MTYFYLSLALTLLVTICLFSLLLRRLKINWAKQNRRKFSFILPSILTLILLAFTIFELKPRLLDTLDIIQNNIYTYSANSQDMEFVGKRIKYGDKLLIRSPWAPPLKPDTMYRVRYAKYSGLVLELDIQMPEEIPSATP